MLTYCLTTHDHRRTTLEQHKVYDASRKIAPDGEYPGYLLVPVLGSQSLPSLPVEVERIEEVVLPASAIAIAKAGTPYQTLVHDLQEFATTHKLPDEAAIVGTDAMQVPKRWEQHGDLILLADSTFSQPSWQTLVDQLGFWPQVAASLRCQRLAVKSIIADTLTRDAQVSLKVGHDGWVMQVDNGIRCTWDVTTCMFSAGNITEKLRVADFACDGQVVVDLFAGIGYFTLPYLLHAKAACVHACEWNPHAIEALRRNLELNEVGDQNAQG
jgi:tRNA wybutosine-synthesizing protein 2